MTRGLHDFKKKLQQVVEWPIKHATAFAILDIYPTKQQNNPQTHKSKVNHIRWTNNFFRTNKTSNLFSLLRYIVLYIFVINV